MKTSLEELIDYIEEFTKKNKNTNGIWSKAKSLIDKEKEDLKRAFVFSEREMHNSFSNDYYKKKKFDDFYKETFSDNVEVAII